MIIVSIVRNLFLLIPLTNVLYKIIRKFEKSQKSTHFP
jgi:glycopeptide antibiotics resistance protein